MTYDKWEEKVSESIRELLLFDVEDSTSILTRAEKAKELEAIAKEFRLELED